MPAAAAFEPTRRGDLDRAWQQPERFDLLAAESETTEEAAAHLRAVADWLAVADELVEGELVRVAAIEARLETLYVDVRDTFDRPQLREWRPYSVADGGLAPAFEGGWTIDPAPIATS